MSYHWRRFYAPHLAFKYTAPFDMEAEAGGRDSPDIHRVA